MSEHDEKAEAHNADDGCGREIHLILDGKVLAKSTVHGSVTELVVDGEVLTQIIAGKLSRVLAKRGLA